MGCTPRRRSLPGGAARVVAARPRRAELERGGAASPWWWSEGTSLGRWRTRTIAALAACCVAGCGTPVTRGTRIQFFPALHDEGLQDASYDAVVRTLQRNGATITGTTSAEVRASVPMQCSGRAVVADLRFARTAGPQSVGVRLCSADARRGAGCVEGTPERTPSGPCGDRTAQLLSNIERDLADHMMAKVPVASPGRGAWWDDTSLGGLASLVSIRRWAPEREPWWAASGHSTLIASSPVMAASPLRAGRALAALDRAQSDPAPVEPRPAARKPTAVRAAR